MWPEPEPRAAGFSVNRSNNRERTGSSRFKHLASVAPTSVRFYAHFSGQRQTWHYIRSDIKPVDVELTSLAPTDTDQTIIWDAPDPAIPGTAGTYVPGLGIRVTRTGIKAYVLAACRTRCASNCQPIEFIRCFRWRNKLPVQQNQWVRG